MKNADNILSDKLNAYESDFSSVVLDNVLLQVNKEEKDRKYFIWLWFGLALFVLSSAYFILNETSTSSPTDSNLISKNNFASSAIIDETIVKEKATPAAPQTPIEKLIPANNDEELILYNKETKNLKVLIEPSEKVAIPTPLESFRNTPKSKAQLYKGNALVDLEVKTATARRQSINKLTRKFDQLIPVGLRMLSEPIGCPGFSDNARKPIFLEAYISHDLPFRQLSDNSTESQAAYINRRNSSESPVYSYHGGVRASSNLISNIVLRLGIDYAQITEKFKVTNLESTREVIIRDADGNIISTTTEQGFRDIVKYNKIKSLNIPISLGWQSQLGKIGLSFHGGVAFNVVSNHQGVILDSGTLPMPRIVSSESDAEQAAFKADIGLSAIGSVGLAYPMTDKIDFLLEPNVKYILNPINISTYQIEQRMFTAGLLTGIRYKF